jgi:hypothetical protein
MSDIFISYARADRAKAETLAHALEQQGWSVWWDFQILPGESFSRVIETAIEDAKCVVVLWSKTSVSSEWVQNEASEGARRGILIPALIEDVKIPLGFRGKHAARLIDWQGESSNPEFKQLLKAVAKILSHQEVKKTENTDAESWRAAFLADMTSAQETVGKIAEKMRANAAKQPLDDDEILDILKKHLWPGMVELAPIDLKRFSGSPVLSAIPETETILGVVEENHVYLMFTGRAIYFKGDRLPPKPEVARIPYEHFWTSEFELGFDGINLDHEGVFPLFKRPKVLKLLAVLNEIKQLAIKKDI